MTFKPLLSKRSLKIAAKLSKSKERLQKNPSNNKLIEQEKEWNYRQEIRKKSKPKINKKSEYLDKKYR